MRTSYNRFNASGKTITESSKNESSRCGVSRPARSKKFIIEKLKNFCFMIRALPEPSVPPHFPRTTSILYQTISNLSIPVWNFLINLTLQHSRANCKRISQRTARRVRPLLLSRRFISVSSAASAVSAFGSTLSARRQPRSAAAAAIFEISRDFRRSRHRSCSENSFFERFLPQIFHKEEVRVSVGVCSDRSATPKSHPGLKIRLRSHRIPAISLIPGKILCHVQRKMSSEQKFAATAVSTPDPDAVPVSTPAPEPMCRSLRRSAFTRTALPLSAAACCYCTECRRPPNGRAAPSEPRPARR